MGRIDQTITFGPVAGVEGNVIHLASPYQGRQQHQLEAIGTLADHTKAIADLMRQLSAEIASIDTKGDLGLVVSATERLGRTFGTVGCKLETWEPQTTLGGHSVSSEKNAL